MIPESVHIPYKKEVFRIYNTFQIQFSCILKKMVFCVLQTVASLPSLVLLELQDSQVGFLGPNGLFCYLLDTLKFSGLLSLGSFTNLGSCSELQQSLPSLSKGNMRNGPVHGFTLSLIQNGEFIRF